MIKFSLKYKNKESKKIQKAILNLYTSWNELTLSHYERLCEAKLIEDDIQRQKEFIKILSIENSCDNIIQFFSPEILLAIDGIIFFINKTNDIPLPLMKNITDNISVEISSWRKLNTCHDALNANKDNIILAARQCIEAYTDFNCDENSFNECLAIFYDISKKIEAFHEKFKALHEYQHSAIEIKAGVQIFEELKWFHTAKALAKGNLLDIESILDQPAVMVYMTLIDDMMLANYKEKLEEIKSE